MALGGRIVPEIGYAYFGYPDWPQHIPAREFTCRFTMLAPTSLVGGSSETQDHQ
ncbi:Protein of unknown function [Pyronema omphalodes CBS 100304]|uniref:Uncharacterized protein n=1 Tax=Pyronema omphalodes (strain CBS 100304) TaxID=1076935 RepID=U4LRJ2_PYROM|nr:Protein of unknown function [Pyronema omphalodes CBS 100304]